MVTPNRFLTLDRGINTDIARYRSPETLIKQLGDGLSPYSRIERLVRGRQLRPFSELRRPSISLRFIVRATPGSVEGRTVASGITGSNRSS